MSGVWLLALAPGFIWLWRSEIVNLVSDCIAAGIKKSREQSSPASDGEA